MAKKREKIVKIIMSDGNIAKVNMIVFHKSVDVNFTGITKIVKLKGIGGYVEINIESPFYEGRNYTTGGMHLRKATKKERQLYYKELSKNENTTFIIVNK